MWNDRKQIKVVEPEVFVVWKQLGNTPLEELHRVRNQLGLSDEVKMTYAGRLDPAAEGELLVLTGNACKRKDEFLGLDKTYTFKVLVGFKTDTLDLMGLVVDKNQTLTSLYSNQLEELSNKLIGKHLWPYPAYSSRPIAGKPLWQWAREGQYQQLLDEDKVPINEFEIKALHQLGSVQKISAKELFNYIEALTNAVAGDFRQNEVFDSWERAITASNQQDFQLLEFETRLSSGGYVRQVAQAIGQKLAFPVTTFSIARTKIWLEN